MPRLGAHKKQLKPKASAPPVNQRDPYNKLSAGEVRLARPWYKEDGMEPSEIASLLRRGKSTMTRLLAMQKDIVRGDHGLFSRGLVHPLAPTCSSN